MTIGISRHLTPLCAFILAIACSSDRTTAPDDGAKSLASATPNVVSVSPGYDFTVNLYWQDRATVETGFEVHRSSTGADGTFLLVATVPANTTSFPDAGRAPLTEYCYQVRAVRNAGGRLTYSPFSTTACATTGPPGAPTNVRAMPDGAGEAIIVSWIAAPAAVRYRVERSGSVAGPWLVLGEALTNREWIDRDVAVEQQECYRVASQSPYGDSAASPVCTALPAPPAGLAAAARLTGGIDVTWADGSAVEDGYEIRRSTDPFDDNFVTIGAVPTNASSYYDAAAMNNTRYWYHVRTKKDGGYSRLAEAEGLNSTVAPNAPSSVSALPQSSTGALVRWMGPPGNTTGFTVERSTNGGAWVPVGTTHWQTTWYGDAGLTPDARVCYRVLSVNDRGDSPPSVNDCTAAPRAPTNLVATPAERGTIALTWRDESDVEEGYDVQRVSCSGDEEWGYVCVVTTVATVGPGVTSFRVTGLTPGVVGVYQVVAFIIRGSERGYSDPSNQVSAAAPSE